MKNKFAQNLVNFLKKNYFLILILIYLSLTLQYFGQAPSLDPVVIYREGIIIFTNGFDGFVVSNSSNSVHPPLNYASAFILFPFLGISPIAYNISGLVLFSISAYLLTHFLEAVFKSKKISFICSLIFLFNPLIVISFLYPIAEVPIIICLLLVLYGYKLQKPWTLGLGLALSIISKETGILILATFIPVIIAESIFAFRNNKINRLRFFLPGIFLSIIMYLSWSYYKYFYGIKE